MSDEPKKPRGRPNRRAATEKALAGIDPSAVDPLMVLAEVACDRSAPAASRVSAAKALLDAARAEEIRKFNEQQFGDLE